MVESKFFTAQVAGNAVDTELGTLTCPDNQRITILEVSYHFDAAGTAKAFLRNEELDDVNSLAAADANNPIVRNIVLSGGDFFRMTGTDTSGAANDIGFVLTYDRVNT